MQIQLFVRRAARALILASSVVACGGKTESDAAPADASVNDGHDAALDSSRAALDSSRADAQPVDAGSDVAPTPTTGPGACAASCFDTATSQDFALRASSCVCPSCPDCSAGALCGGGSAPTDACVRCFGGLFGPAGACTTDSSYKTYCASVPHCQAMSDCILACDRAGH